MKTKLFRSTTLCLVALIMVFQMGVTASAASLDNFFTDVPPDSPWYEGITFAAEQGITNGTGNQCFSPDTPITVRQWAVMLCRAYGEEEALEKDANSFGDFCATQAYWNGWIPMEAVTHPDDNICRGALYRSAFSVLGLSIYNYELFPGGFYLSDYENCVRVATELGICTEGASATELITRGEAVYLIYKMLSNEYAVEEPPVVYEYPIENPCNVDLSPYLQELVKVPEPIMTSFRNRGWKYSIDFESLAEISKRYGMTCIGACDYASKHIFVSEASSTLHEFGHYLDYSLGRISRSSAFYSEEAQAAGAFLRDYALTSPAEYFADYFVYWFNYHDVDWRVEQMKELTPKTYAYFTDLAADNWGYGSCGG